MKPVAGVVENWREAERAMSLLRDAGFDSDRVRVIAGDARAAFAAAPERGVEVVAGTAGGASIGSLVGGMMGWIVDAVELGAVEIEEIIAAGPVATLIELADPMVIAGVGLGGIVGGLLGTHAGWSFAESVARTYSRAVEHGSVMLVVESRDDRDGQHAVAALKQARAQHIHSGMSDS